MSRRLLLSYVLLVLFVLAVLEIPLGLSFARNGRQDLTAKLERDAVALATLSQSALENPADTDQATLTGLADRYQRETGGRVVIVDASGVALVDSDPPEPGRRTFATRPEVSAALGGEVATGVRHSRTLGLNLLYVAVPVATSGVVYGAVRISYPTSTIERRVTRFWLLLGAIAVVVLLAASLVGRRFARSIAQPLRDLERAAAAAGGGDLAARAQSDVGPPEIRSLAASFNDTVEKLEELIRSQEEFVADAAHQLRTPLAALRLRLENLDRDVAPPGRGDLDGALVEVGRLSRLVDGLLTLARVDSAAAAPESVDLRAAVEERLEAWSALAAEQDVALSAEVEVGLTAKATPGRIEQVLDNLLANALEISPAGASIAVLAARVGPWAELHVVDQGPGMSPEERAHAFHRFWRANSGRGGAGLGLAIVDRFVTSDGGDVRLLAASGGGVDAVVRLRAATPVAEAAHRAATQPVAH